MADRNSYYRNSHDKNSTDKNSPHPYSRNRRTGKSLFHGFFLLCAGCVLIAVGLSLGGRLSAFNWHPWDRDGNNFNWHDFRTDNSITEAVTLEDIIPADIRSIEIHLSAASLVIREGEIAGYRAIDFGKDGIEISKNGKEIRFKELDWEHRFGFDKNLKPVLEITLENGKKLDTCEITVGAGTLNLNTINTQKLRLESGAGAIKGHNLTADTVQIRTGAGSLEFEKCFFNDTEIETGAGRIVFEGDFLNRAEITTGAGEIELTLDGLEKDYRINFIRGLGSVKIGEATFSGVGNGSGGNKDAKRQLKVSTGIGSVQISFKEQ